MIDFFQNDKHPVFTEQKVNAPLENGVFDPNFREVRRYTMDDSQIGFATGKVRERPKLEGGRAFVMNTEFEPAGDQPNAIAELSAGVLSGERDQVLLGATGTGKTFTMAKIIEETQRPAIILAPNKTLAAQLYGEMKDFFPENAVEYFVSYYDYYQPEAYVPRSDTYIEKESSINDQIDRMRHSATRALLERKDVIIIASVSCIYGIGSVETYSKMIVNLKIGEEVSRQKLLRQFTELQYTRNDMSFVRGTFRVRGDSIEIFPAHLESIAWRITLFGDEIEEIYEVDALTGEKLAKLKTVKIYANSHYVTPRPTLNEAIKSIKEELKVHLEILYKNNKLVEAQRLEQRTNFDIEMMLAAGTCPGIENYSRYLSGRNPGEPPPTLFEYLPDNALVFTDESHITVSQIGAMYKGDFRRKSTLSEYGFRLPSCLDNRPLKFEEWEAFRPQTIHVSATPGDWELNKTNGVFIEQALRPTGLVDPEIIIRPTKTQVDDLIYETKEQSKKGNRVLITTLTKKMAEALSEYMFEAGLKVRYIHSDVDTLERIEIIRDLRLGLFDALIGINLLREGLDIPECALVAILDADKEGYLRSKTSLIQTIGRAARHVEGKVVLYADTITGSMKYAIDETERRRRKQIEYNKTNNITPKTVISKISDILAELNNNEENQKNKKSNQTGKTIKQSIEELEIEMDKAASNLEFEEAAKIRDEIKKLKQKELGLMIVPKENNLNLLSKLDI